MVLCPAGAAQAAGGYAEAVAGTSGLIAYWRLGETSGMTATDVTGRAPGSLLGGVGLGARGALSGDADTAARFDGVDDELQASGGPGAATLEGWFFWEAGVALLRDDTSGGGWILAYDSGGRIACRAGGTALVSTTPVSEVRDGRWHHFALTRDRDEVRLYLDGRRLTLPADPPGTATAAAPWRVMHNGSTVGQYSRGLADEIAIYDRPLTAADIRQRAALGK